MTTTWLKQARQLHLYLGLFFAPSIVFFAFSGTLQVFGLHEGRPGGTYQPPAWIVKLASIHKDQMLKKQGPSPDTSETIKPSRPLQDPKEENQVAKIPTYALKWFFVLMALGLIATTCLGVYMAFKFNRSRTLVWSLLLLGAAIPIALIATMV